MGETSLLSEARRLWEKGFAILWLHPKSKRPVETGWTTGPRKEWDELERTYRPGYNVGTRLGKPSRLGGNFLAVIDVDIRTTDRETIKKAIRRAKELFEGHACPMVRSGRGNGSRHYYYRTSTPFKAGDIAESTDLVRCHMPSKRPSRSELEKLTPKEIKDGIRFAKAWAISLYSEGRQVVLPPSIHPDSLKPYEWGVPLKEVSEIPLLDLSTESDGVEEKNVAVLKDFKITPVEIAWLPVSEKVRAGILTGEDVPDRSSFLLKASTALLSAGLTQNEVLTVLTDPDTFIGECAYEHAQTESRKRAAEWVYRYTLQKAEKEKSAPSEIFAVEAVKPRKLTAEEQARQAREFHADWNWKQDIIRDKSGRPSKLINNIIMILLNAVSPLVVRRDLFATRDSYGCDTPWGGKKNNIISDDDVDELQSWLGLQYGFEPPKNVVESALVVIARRNSFDPVKDRLEALPAWDGVPRLDGWLKKNFGAKGDDNYLGQVFRKWMVGMIMRVYRPGAKFDWMPIFEGAQGVGKSSFGKLLVGDKYFLDWLPNLHDKDSALSLQGMWCVEMGELSQFRRNELETIKAFLTRTVDKIRPPFGKRLVESPRRCVFFGTTNRQTYLIDETGNRRFKPVVVGELNFEVLENERGQLFAEAVHLFKTKKETEFKLELSGRARTFERQIQLEKMVEDDSNSMAECMLNFIEKVEKKQIKFDLGKFRIIDLFEGVGPFGGWRKENRNFQFAAKMLHRLQAKDRVIHGRKYWEIPKTSFF